MEKVNETITQNNYVVFTSLILNSFEEEVAGEFSEGSADSSDSCDDEQSSNMLFY